MTQQQYDTVVVGAGLGGLTAGAKLAHAGRDVLVLERHSIPIAIAYIVLVAVLVASTVMSTVVMVIVRRLIFCILSVARQRGELITKPQIFINQ